MSKRQKKKRKKRTKDVSVQDLKERQLRKRLERRQRQRKQEQQEEMRRKLESGEIDREELEKRQDTVDPARLQHESFVQRLQWRRGACADGEEHQKDESEQADYDGDLFPNSSVNSVEEEMVDTGGVDLDESDIVSP